MGDIFFRVITPSLSLFGTSWPLPIAEGALLFILTNQASSASFPFSCFWPQSCKFTCMSTIIPHFTLKCFPLLNFPAYIKQLLPQNGESSLCFDGAMPKKVMDFSTPFLCSFVMPNLFSQLEIVHLIRGLAPHVCNSPRRSYLLFCCPC